MQKTPFAGLTELDVSESILEDNGAFTGRDRETIDRFLQVGAKTHRHDGSAGLSNPTNAPSAAVIASAGTIAADLSLNIGYTAQDEQRGETLLSPIATVSTPGPLTEPQQAPSAEVKYDAGNLTQDNYYYGISYVDAEGGETPLGPVVIATRQPGHANARVSLTHINDGMAAAGATAWRLYRQRAGGAFAYLASGTTSSYMDEGNVSPVCDINPPNDNFNTTNSVNTLKVTLPSKANLPSGTAYINLYLSQSGTFTGQTFLEQFPVASAGQTIVYKSLELQDDQPPDVNTSIGGAAKITLSEIEGLQWKAPVTASASLGSGEKGDVKLSEIDGYLYAVLLPSAGVAKDWTRIASGAEVSASGVGGKVSGLGDFTFVGSGGTTIQVQETAKGKVKVTVTGGSAGAGESNLKVTASGTSVSKVSELEVVGSGIAVKEEEPTPGKVKVTIGAPVERLRVGASGVTVGEVETLEIAGSGGIRLEESTPAAKNAKVLVEGDRAKLGQEGMGTIRITSAEKGIPRPNTFRTYTWFCKVKPTNMAEFDIWIEEGP